MKCCKVLICCCICALLLLLLGGCGLSGLQPSGVYYGPATDSPVPALIAAPVTPAPTATPNILSYDLNQSLFRRDGVTAAVTNITYLQYIQVSATVSINNRTNQALSFDPVVAGSVNGWSISFTAPEEMTAIVIEPQSAASVTLTALLDRTSAEWMALEDIASLGLTFSGLLGERTFAPTANLIQTPAPAQETGPDAGKDALLLHENSQARFYFHHLDSVSAMVYISIQLKGGPLTLTAIPKVNGYALGAQGQQVTSSPTAQRVMMTVPLLPTIQTYAINELEDLRLCVVMAQNNKDLGGDNFSVPLTENAIAALKEAAQQNPSDNPGSPIPTMDMETDSADSIESAPDYRGSGRTFYQDEDIQIYYESAQPEPSDYYGRVTRCRMVCVNNTASTLYPSAATVKLAGAMMDGGFEGYIPPYSQTVFELLICANINPGSGLFVEMTILDGGNRMHRVVHEDISFTA